MIRCNSADIQSEIIIGDGAHCHNEWQLGPAKKWLYLGGFSP